MEYHGAAMMAKMICYETSEDECEYELRNIINIIASMIRCENDDVNGSQHICSHSVVWRF